MQLENFTLRASGVGLISSMRSDNRKNVQSLKLVLSALHAEHKAHILPILEGIIKDAK